MRSLNAFLGLLFTAYGPQKSGSSPEVKMKKNSDRKLLLLLTYVLIQHLELLSEVGIVGAWQERRKQRCADCAQAGGGPDFTAGKTDAMAFPASVLSSQNGENTTVDGRGHVQTLTSSGEACTAALQTQTPKGCLKLMFSTKSSSRQVVVS